MKTFREFLDETIEVNELSRKTLASYVTGAAYDVKNKSTREAERRTTVNKAINNLAQGESDAYMTDRDSSNAINQARHKLQKAHDAVSAKADKKIHNRTWGIRRAAKKLAKEETVVESRDLTRAFVKAIEKKTGGKQTASRDRAGVLRLKIKKGRRK
jgi:hypothetical protein